MNLRHTNTNNVICALDVNEKKELTLETIEVPSLQQEEIEESISMNSKMLSTIKIAGLDDVSLEDLNNAKTVIKNIIESGFIYPVFKDFLQNISTKQIRFDDSVITQQFIKANNPLSIMLFSEQENRGQFYDLFEVIHKETPIPRMSKTIEEFLEEKSKNNTVSVSFAEKAYGYGCKCALIINNAKINEEQTITITRPPSEIYFASLLEFTSIIDAYLAKFIVIENIKSIIITPPCVGKLTSENFISILFTLFELSKMMNKRAKMDGERKLTLFYHCNDKYHQLLDMLYDISKQYFSLS
jgi:hypothetical protein